MRVADEVAVFLMELAPDLGERRAVEVAEELVRIIKSGGSCEHEEMEIVRRYLQIPIDGLIKPNSILADKERCSSCNFTNWREHRWKSKMQKSISSSSQLLTKILGEMS